MPSADALFVETAWLDGRIGDPTVAVFDASYFPAGIDRDPAAEFVARRIPGAHRFGIRELSDPGSPLPNMLPRRDDLAGVLSDAGVRRGSTVVLYDSLGVYGAARALWTLRRFGIGRSRILAGGLPRWIAEGRGLASGIDAPARSTPRSSLEVAHPDGTPRMSDVIDALADGSAQLIDARSPVAPSGSPVPRAPGFTRVPHDLFVRDGVLDPPAVIRETARAHGLALDRPAIVACGTGVAASVVWLALTCVGAPVRLYDGGFAEWMPPSPRR